MNNIEFRKSAINPSNCISDGWELIKPDYWLFFGMAIVEMLIIFVIGLIPVVNVFNSIIAGPLMCGIYIAILAKLKNENVSFSMMFEGFNRFLPAVLVSLLPAIPMIIVSFAAYFMDSIPASISPLNPTFYTILFWISIYLVSFGLGLLLFFSLPLIAEHNLGFADAITLSINAAVENIGGLIVLFILEGLVSLVGTLAFCIGLFFVLPVIYAANIVAYKSVFPDPQPSFFNEPPSPEEYDENYGIRS